MHNGILFDLLFWLEYDSVVSIYFLVKYHCEEAQSRSTLRFFVCLVNRVVIIVSLLVTQACSFGDQYHNHHYVPYSQRRLATKEVLHISDLL